MQTKAAQAAELYQAALTLTDTVVARGCEGFAEVFMRDSVWQG
jgi:hypothetical protein